VVFKGTKGNALTRVGLYTSKSVFARVAIMGLISSTNAGFLYSQLFHNLLCFGFIDYM
jgi:hypothetical protein